MMIFVKNSGNCVDTARNHTQRCHAYEQPARYCSASTQDAVSWSRVRIGQARMPHQSSRRQFRLHSGGGVLCLHEAQRLQVSAICTCIGDLPTDHLSMWKLRQPLALLSGWWIQLPSSSCASRSCISPADLQGNLISTAGCIAWVLLLTDPGGQRDISACASSTQAPCVAAAAPPSIACCTMPAPSLQALPAHVALCMCRLEAYAPPWLWTLLAAVACVQALRKLHAVWPSSATSCTQGDTTAAAVDWSVFSCLQHACACMHHPPAALHVHTVVRSTMPLCWR
jgi:hypothetical protein